MPADARLARARLVDPVKALEDARQILRADADAAVAHGQPRPPAIGIDAHRHVDLAALRRELDRVVDQVAHDLAQVKFVAGDHHRGELAGVQPDAARLGDPLEHVERFAHHLVEPY